MGIRSWVASKTERPYWREVRKRAWADTWALLAPSLGWRKLVPATLAALVSVVVGGWWLGTNRPAIDALQSAAVLAVAWGGVSFLVFAFHMNSVPARLTREETGKVEEAKAQSAEREAHFREEAARCEVEITRAAAEREERLRSERDAALQRVEQFEDKRPELHARICWHPYKINASWIAEHSDGWMQARIAAEVAQASGETRICALFVGNSKPGTIAKGVRARVEVRDARGGRHLIKRAVWLAEDTPERKTVDLVDLDPVDLPNGVERILALFVSHGEAESAAEPIHYALDSFSRQSIRWARSDMRVAGPRLDILIMLTTDDATQLLRLRSEGYRLEDLGSDVPVQTYQWP